MWQLLKNYYHHLQAVIAIIWYGFPADSMIIIGVTGTDGKTTTANIIYTVLKNAGYKAAVISSIGAMINDKKYDTGFHVTTPDVFALQAYLKSAKHAGAKYIVLEVTSHALDQGRVFAVPFTIGVLTNITHEHLDYHRTYDRYARTKAKLLKTAKIAVINRNDSSFIYMSSILRNKKIITYGLDKKSDINPNIFPFKTNLKGNYNLYNSLAAIAACRALSVPDKVIRTGVEAFKTLEGRFDIVYKNSFSVIIDFAHTPNALGELLSTVRILHPDKRLIHVFGSAGARDNSKRPLMGKKSALFSDIVILTAEDPRKESIESIMDAIEKGIPNNFRKHVKKIADRQIAIDEAIHMAKKGDIILITGKGHERSMNYGNGEIPWSDYDAVERALKSIKET